MSHFCLEVTGDFACFTRPEMKVERVSYDVITPSAARAIFESILWKPAIRWQITKIEVLNPIRWINIRRNEVSTVVSQRNIKTVMGGGRAGLQIVIEEDRQQRAGLLLRDVAYRLYAQFNLQDDSQHRHRYPHLQCADSTGSDNTYVKFEQMFKRRASKGQCFNQPYLGTREFSCAFRYIDVERLDEVTASSPAINESKELGWMLYDMDFNDLKDPKPKFFNAVMHHGVIDVPEWHSKEVVG